MFRENGIVGKSLEKMTKRDLKKMGLKVYGDIIRWTNQDRGQCPENQPFGQDQSTESACLREATHAPQDSRKGANSVETDVNVPGSERYW